MDILFYSIKLFYFNWIKIHTFFLILWIIIIHIHIHINIGLSFSFGFGTFWWLCEKEVYAYMVIENTWINSEILYIHSQSRTHSPRNWICMAQTPCPYLFHSSPSTPNLQPAIRFTPRGLSDIQTATNNHQASLHAFFHHKYLSPHQIFHLFPINKLKYLFQKIYICIYIFL